MIALPPWLNVLLLLSAVVVGWLEARRISGRVGGERLEVIVRKEPHLYVLLPFFFGLFAINLLLQRRPLLMWDWPLWLQYYYSALTWGSILAVFGVLFAFITTLSFQRDHRDRWKFVIAAIIFVAVIQAVQWVYTKPLAEDLYEKKTSDGAILQSSFSSCVAASAANILCVYDRPRTEKEVATLLGTTLVTGTTAAQLVHGMGKIDVLCRMVAIPGAEIDKVNVPAILFVDYVDSEDHAVALLGISPDGVELVDPLFGRKFLSSDELRKIWHGRAVEFDLTK